MIMVRAKNAHTETKDVQTTHESESHNADYSIIVTTIDLFTAHIFHSLSSHVFSAAFKPIYIFHLQLSTHIWALDTTSLLFPL